jgi:hypothetical protein
MRLWSTGISVLARIGMRKKVSTYLDPWILRSVFLPAWPPCSLKDRRRGEGGGAGENDQGLGHGWLFYRRNLNIRWPKINYSYVIHPTSESSTWIVKRSRFNETFTSAVSDRPSEQRFKKSKFQSTPEPLSFFWCYKLCWIYSISKSSINNPFS